MPRRTTPSSGTGKRPPPSPPPPPIFPLEPTLDPNLLTPIQKLAKDVRDAAHTLGVREARFLVDAYYTMQNNRIRSAHQLRTLAQITDEEEPPEPHDVIAWLLYQQQTLEHQIQRALDAYSAAHPVGVWARSITGIGPVLAAGLLANIDITKAETAGALWRFAGLDPTSLWIGSEKAREIVANALAAFPSAQTASVPNAALTAICQTINVHPLRLQARLTDPKTGAISMAREAVVKAVAKRPWNANLKRLCFLIGDSFVKVSNNPSDFYGKIYQTRKELEISRNERGIFQDQAKAALEEKNFRRDTSARRKYLEGKLPDARIHMRAQRYAVKLFLSHLHEVMHWFHFRKLPPNPYPIQSIPGHSHRIQVPHIDLIPGLAQARRGVRNPPKLTPPSEGAPYSQAQRKPRTPSTQPKKSSAPSEGSKAKPSLRTRTPKPAKSTKRTTAAKPKPRTTKAPAIPSTRPQRKAPTTRSSRIGR